MTAAFPLGRGDDAGSPGRRAIHSPSGLRAVGLARGRERVGGGREDQARTGSGQFVGEGSELYFRFLTRGVASPGATRGAPVRTR